MMKQLLYTTFAAALWATPGVAQSAQSPSIRPSTGSDNPRTITGCVAPGTDTGTYTITESAPPTDPSTEREPAVAAEPASGGTWTLKADTNVDLSRYVGKRVAITGSSDRRGGMSADPDSSTTRPSAATAGPQFHVKSVKIVAESCS
jgi:hypothetical protein